MKTYVKPDLVYESFELSQNIATCGFDVNFTNYDVCYAVGDENEGMFNVTLFTQVNENCEAKEGENADSYCYEPSSAAWGLFNS